MMSDARTLPKHHATLCFAKLFCLYPCSGFSCCMISFWFVDECVWITGMGHKCFSEKQPQRAFSSYDLTFIRNGEHLYMPSFPLFFISCGWSCREWTRGPGFCFWVNGPGFRKPSWSQLRLWLEQHLSCWDIFKKQHVDMSWHWLDVSLRNWLWAFSFLVGLKKEVGSGRESGTHTASQ